MAYPYTKENDLLDHLLQEYPDEIPTIDINLGETSLAGDHIVSEFDEEGWDLRSQDEENPDFIAYNIERSSHAFMAY